MILIKQKSYLRINYQNINKSGQKMAGQPLSLNQLLKQILQVMPMISLL